MLAGPLEYGLSVHFEYTFSGGTKADCVLYDRDGRPLAVIEAKQQSTMPTEVRTQRMRPKSMFRYGNTRNRPFIDGICPQAAGGHKRVARPAILSHDQPTGRLPHGESLFNAYCFRNAKSASRVGASHAE
jgi:hypothetical protein